MESSRIEFGLLGPLLVEVGGRPVELTGTRTKAVLAVLLANANSVVSADRLVDDLWSGQPTRGATVTLQGYVSDLRRALSDALGEPAPVVTRRPGYLLRIDTDQLDVLRFERLVAEAKTLPGGEDAGRRAGLLREALAQWRGPALADLADEDFARPIAARLEEARLWALEERVDAELGTGCHGELVTELRTLAAENPLRERLWGQLMLALYRCGRQAEALRTYQDLRRRLGDELAIDPSPALQRLEHAILTQDPSLEVARAPEPIAPAAARPNLPIVLTRFVGRERELEETRLLLSRSRLLTLAGSSGSGKTRLAVELVAGEAGRWRDGVWFVDLSVVRTSDGVPAAVAAAMGLSQHGADVRAVCEHIGDTQRLLLLDNCEHLIDACAELVEAVLSSCPSTTVLATSQEELRLASETVWRVPPLTLPLSGEHSDPERLLASEAVQLFLERASSLRNVAEDLSALETVAHICRRLDGIPLAIELAASLVAVLPLEEIRDRLDDRLALLTRGYRGAVSRHRTLRAATDWSYELLEGSERELFDRLSVFVGQFSLEAAEAAGRRGGGDLVADLSALVSKSMVSTVPGPGGTRRYQLLDSLRIYGLERLRAAGQEEDARSRHAAYYMSLAVAADHRLRGPDAADASTRVIEELPNIRAALEWSFSGGDVEVGVQLASALRRGGLARVDRLVQARGWLDAALAPEHGLPPPMRLKALIAAIAVAISQGDFRASSTLGAEAVALAEELGDRQEMTFALVARGGALVFQGQLAEGIDCLEQSLAYCRETGDDWTKASVLTYLGVASRRAGDSGLAERQLTEASSLYRALGDNYNLVVPLIQLALVAQRRGALDEAMEYCDESIALARRLGDRQVAHGALCIGGIVELARGHPEQARQLLVTSLTTGRGVEHFLMVAMAVEGFAVLAHGEGRDSQAALLWGFAEELRSKQAVTLNGQRLAERDRLLADARAGTAPRLWTMRSPPGGG